MNINFQELLISKEEKNNNIRVARIISDEGLFTKYLVTSEGQIFSIKKSGTLRKMKPARVGTGYYTVNISINKVNKKYLVHRLVALVFIPNPENKKQVNHKDGDKSNNILENLEWNTPKENIIHSYVTGLHKVGFGEESNNPKITKKKAKQIYELLETNEFTLDEIAEVTETTRSIVYNIKHKLAWIDISKDYKVENHTLRSDGSKKLAKSVVIEICKLLEDGKLTISEIRDKTNVSNSAILDIANRESWENVSKNYNVEMFNRARAKTDKKRIKKVKDICNDLQNTNIDIKDIAMKHEVPYQYVYNIFTRRTHKYISKYYNFESRNSLPKNLVDQVKPL